MCYRKIKTKTFCVYSWFTRTDQKWTLHLFFFSRLSSDDWNYKLKIEVDPQGVEGQRRKTINRRNYYTDGPDDVYHIDGNDKLKEWGFAIHGGIDGFSRKIL